MASLKPTFFGGSGSGDGGVITLNSTGRLVMGLTEKKIAMSLTKRKLGMVLPAQPRLTMRLIRST